MSKDTLPLTSLSVLVAGAGFKQNPGKLAEGEAAYIERDPHNPVHCNAIAVLDKFGNRAGWIPRDLADSLSPAILEGKIKIIGCFAESSRIKNVIKSSLKRKLMNKNVFACLHIFACQ